MKIKFTSYSTVTYHFLFLYVTNVTLPELDCKGVGLFSFRLYDIKRVTRDCRYVRTLDIHRRSNIV